MLRFETSFARSVAQSFAILFAVYFLGVSGQAQNALKTPNISANALFLYRNSNQNTATTRNGIDIEEAEINFYADVDPYSRLNMVLTVAPEYSDVPQPGQTLPASQTNESWKIEPEELYAETNEIPRFTFKVGKFKAAFGRHNLLHSHAFPFIDVPLVNAMLLGGDDGLNDVGLSAAYLLPTERWYSEVTAQYLRGGGTNTEFRPPSSNDGVALFHYKSLFDISESATVEAGVSYAYGANSTLSFTNLQGADLTFKWRPVNGGKYHSGIAGIEYIRRTMGQMPRTMINDEIDTGGNVWGQYQFAERWAANARYDFLNVNDAVTVAIDPSSPLENLCSQRYTAGVTFTATEFSAYRLEYSEGHGQTLMPYHGNEKRIYVLANYTIGSHPAHSY